MHAFIEIITSLNNSKSLSQSADPNYLTQPVNKITSDYAVISSTSSALLI